MPSRVIITGGTGFIGSAVVAQLLKKGAYVTVLLRPGSSIDRLRGMSGVDTIVYTSMREADLAAQLREREPESFIHCGWRGVGGADRNQHYQVSENIPMTLDTVELAAEAGCRQWIGLGSQAEYGNQNCRMNEEAPLRPTTLYGKAKLAAGIAGLALVEAHKMAGVWIRVFSTYGPGDSPQWFIPYVTQEMLAGRSPKLTRCEQQWDYLYVDDAARAIAAVADGKTTGVFNLGSGRTRPLKDYVELIRQEVAAIVDPEYGAVPYRSDQVMHLEADVARLVAASGWSPVVSPQEGVRATVAFERKRMAGAPKQGI